MDSREQRLELDRLMRRDAVSMAELSRVIERNAAWVQQYLKRGTPKLLPERERSVLARFFGVDEQVLGGPQRGGLIAVPRFDVAASAGPGRIAGADFADRAVGYSAEDLARLGLRAVDASVIDVAGDSMLPTLADGDEILVDRSQRTLRREGGIWVVRIEGELRVKRLVPGQGTYRIVSDNPDWADEERAVSDVEVLGRVVHLRRRL